MTKTEPLTKARARQILLQAREDVTALLAKQYETQAEIHRVLAITGELYLGITGEEAPEFRVRPEMEQTG